MKKTKIIIPAIGLLVFGFILAKMGWTGVFHQLQVIRRALPVLIGLSSLRLALQTVAWSQTLRAEGIRASVGELIGARVASRGIGYLSVLGPAVSEPMRIKLLREHSPSVTAATLIDTGAYWYSSGVFAIIGCFCAFHYLSGDRHVAPLVALAVLIAVGLILIGRPKPLLPLLVRLLGRRCPGSLQQAGRIEIEIRRFQERHPWPIRLILTLDLACQVLLAAEVAVIFVCFGIPVHAGTVLALEAANRIVRAMGAWLPARIGADETGMAAAFLTFGLPSASGLALALGRRTRDLLEVFLGLGWLAWRSKFPAQQVLARS
jgi:hypothetical protein